MHTSFSTLFVFVLATAQFTPSLAAPVVNERTTIPGHDLAPPPLIFDPPTAGLAFGGASHGALFGRNVAALPGGGGSGVTIIGKRQFPDGFLDFTGDKELPFAHKSNGIIFKRDDDGERLNRGQTAPGAVFGRADINQHFACGGATDLQCPTIPTTAPGLPVPFRELDARYDIGADFQLPNESQAGGAVFGRREESLEARFDGFDMPFIPATGLQEGGKGPGMGIRAETPDKRVVCSTIAGVDCDDLPSPSSVPGFPASVRILKREPPRNGHGPGPALPDNGQGGGAVFLRSVIPTLGGGKPLGAPHVTPPTGLPQNGKGQGAVFGRDNGPRALNNKVGGMFGIGIGQDNDLLLPTQPLIDNSNTMDRRALLNIDKVGGMIGGGFLGTHVDEPSTPTQPIDDGNTELNAPRGLPNGGASNAALWGPAAIGRSEHDSRAVNNGQIRAP
ncbi:hypothetical protein PENSPDRAFT_235026 [Peniophora sp. CONT]|nr:hypothetical protein PENSPDRAFT_235026 [Peniophora sp. CONT]